MRPAARCSLERVRGSAGWPVRLERSTGPPRSGLLEWLTTCAALDAGGSHDRATALGERAAAHPLTLAGPSGAALRGPSTSTAKPQHSQPAEEETPARAPRLSAAALKTSVWWKLS